MFVFVGQQKLEPELKVLQGTESQHSCEANKNKVWLVRRMPSIGI
jgi:hypothetical protein